MEEEEQNSESHFLPFLLMHVQQIIRLPLL